MAAGDFTYPLVFQAGAARSGQAANIIAQVFDNANTQQGSNITASWVEETDAAGNATTGLYRNSTTLNTAWLNARIKYVITGLAGVAAEEVVAIAQAVGGVSGGLPLSVDSSGRVDVLKVNGTSQTARDLGASVLLSVGTGAGQVNLASGKVPATLVSTDVTGNLPANAATIGGQVPVQTAGKLWVLDSSGNALTAGFTGASNVTLQFRDASNAPVSSVAFNVAGTGSGTTDASGNVTVGLNNGSYTVTAAPQSGVLFPSTDITVSGDGTFTITGSAIVIDPPAGPDQITGVGTTFDGQGNVSPNTAVNFKFIRGTDPYNVYSGVTFVLTSDADGVLQGSFVKGATYTGWSGRGGQARILVPDSGTSFNIPDIIGG